jgi:two-component system response regulator FixJ
MKFDVSRIDTGQGSTAMGVVSWLMLNQSAKTSATASDFVILAVDDDSAVLSSLVFALEIDGFKVRSFSTPRELLESNDLPEKGCLVLDYRLPGMNGLALLRALRCRGARFPAVLISAGLNDEIRRQAQKVHVPVLEKPLMASQLSETIKGLLANG